MLARGLRGGMFLGSGIMSQKYYKLARSCAIRNISQTYMQSSVDLLQKEARDIVYNQKLSFVVSYSRQKHEIDYSEISIGTYAPYGTMNNIHDKRWVLGRISNKHSNTDYRVPDHLSPLQHYFDLILAESRNELDVYRFKRNYFDILHETSWAWMRDEFNTLKFGHIDHYKDELNEDTLTPEIKQLLPYIHNVMKVIYLGLKHDITQYNSRFQNSELGFSLQEIYTAGPNPCYGKLKQNGSIGISHPNGETYTSLGLFTTHGPNTLINIPGEFEAKKVDTIDDFYDVYMVGKCGSVELPQMLEFDKTKISHDEYRKIKDIWIEVRDLAFLQLQKDILNNNLS